MTEETMTVSAGIGSDPSGLKGVVTDWSHDRQAFHVPWGKAMMWIFLLSDTFHFLLLPDRLYERQDDDHGCLAEPQ